MKSFYSKRVIKLLLFDKQRGRCLGCQKTFAITKLELDHIIPRAGGGSDIPSNFQLLCKPCNVRKRAYIAEGAQYTLFDKPRERRPREPKSNRPAQELSVSPNAIKKRAQRERARAAGVCVVCISSPAESGYRTCRSCNDAAKDRVSLRRATEKSKTGKPLTGAERAARYRKMHAAEGMCKACVRQKAIEGTTKCPRCMYNTVCSVYRRRDTELPEYAEWFGLYMAKRKKS